jgi:hypothetical protein
MAGRNSPSFWGIVLTSDGVGVYGFPLYTWRNLFDYVRPICLAVLKSDKKAAEYVQTHAFQILRTCQSLHGFQFSTALSSPHFSLDSCSYNWTQRATVI